MEYLKTHLKKKTILRGIGIYLIMLLLFEVCYCHALGKPARGFALGFFDFFKTFAWEDAGLCIKRIMILAYTAMLEIIGFGIAERVCRFTHFRGVLAFAFCLACSIGMTFLIGPLMSLVLFVLKVAGFILFLLFVLSLMLCGGVGSILVLSGLTDSDLDDEQRAALIVVGANWKKLE
ncbi:MAG: hypothetical protein IKT57_00370 [Clostridia bacterium]|nr:hypothetical protein [Clostridia bacterium]